jgi:phosphoglycerate kinase
MGVFEITPFSHGTMAMVDHVAAADAVSIVGGGDTDVAIHKAGKADQISYISTGGGAFLAMLEGKTLPAIAALEKSNV